MFHSQGIVPVSQTRTVRQPESQTFAEARFDRFKRILRAFAGKEYLGLPTIYRFIESEHEDQILRRQVKRTVLRLGRHQRGRFRFPGTQRIAFAEVPDFFRRHDADRVVGMPMPFALYRNKHDLHTVFPTGIPGISGRRPGLAGRIRLDDFRCQVATVKGGPFLHILGNAPVPAGGMSGIPFVVHHVVCRAMRMDDGHGARARRLTVIHGDAAHRAEGGYLIAHLRHGVVGHHAAHGKAGQVHPVAVHVVAVVHRVDNRLQKLYIRIAGYVPSLVDSIGIDHHELGRISHGLPICLPFLIVGILVQSVQ